MSHSERFQDTGMTSVFYQGVDSERERILELFKSVCRCEVPAPPFSCSGCWGYYIVARTHDIDATPRFTDTEKQDSRANARIKGEQK